MNLKLLVSMGPVLGRKAVWWRLQQKELARKVGRLLTCEEELLAHVIPVLSWAVTGTWEFLFIWELLSTQGQALASPHACDDM